VNFALPDLRGRVPIHTGSGHTLGERGGEQAHTVSVAEAPQHTHVANASSANGNQSFANGAILAAAGNLYAGAANLTALTAASITSVGGSQAHQNMQPFLALTFCIALQGIFPSQT
jgi:microcystin-dependent protein